jgi:hypothetical protein
MAQVREHLPSKDETLRSSISTVKKQHHLSILFNWVYYGMSGFHSYFVTYLSSLSAYVRNTVHNYDYLGKPSKSI